MKAWPTSVRSFVCLTHSERRPKNSYSQEEINLFLYHQIGNRNFSIFNYKSVKLDVLCIQNEIWDIWLVLSNLKSCQFAPRLVIFNLCICCQLEDSQIISPKIIRMSHRNI